MKLELKRSDVITNIDLEDRIDIQIQSSAKIINLLTKNLYSQPWKSCVRELMTNAIDANIAAGKADTPIEIEFMPPDRTSMNGFMKITDSGNGMSPEDIRNILATLGVSTKDCSNDQHGGFGIGILSLFSVTSQAQLDTCFDGIRYRYLLLIDENGVPCLKLIDRRDTESIGTSITVPVGDESSAQQVWNAISYYRPFTEPRPTCSGVEFNDFNVRIYRNACGRINGDGFTYYVNPREPGHQVVIALRIGQIVYDLEDSSWSVFKSKSLPAVQNWMQKSLGQLLVVDIPIGTLDLPSSRESIADTAKNKSIVTAAIERAISSCRVKIFDAFRDPGTALGKMALLDRVYFSRNWNIRVVEVGNLDVPIEFFHKELDFFTNIESFRYNTHVSIKLKLTARFTLDLIKEYQANPDRFYIYIGKKDRLRATVRFYNPSAFLTAIYIFAFESETEYLTWSEENQFLLALAPQNQIVRQKTRQTQACSIIQSPVQKLKKWLDKPRGLYRIKLDADFRVNNAHWKLVATPVDTFPKNCICITASYLGSPNSIHLDEYRDILTVLEIEHTEVIVLTDSADKWRKLATNHQDKSFDGFIHLGDYVDNQACQYLEKTIWQFADLKILPLYDYQNHRYVARYLVNKRRYFNSIESCMSRSVSVSTAIGGEKMPLATILLKESLKIGAVLSMAYALRLSFVQTFVREKECKGWKNDPHFKLTLTYLFANLLDRHPVLRYLPCFDAPDEHGDSDLESFISLVKSIDTFLID